MQIPDDKLEEFRELYKKNFGKEISKAEALDSATKLLTLMKIIYQPIKIKVYD
ncbi:hypothetical protein ACFL1Y_00460 [Patescibacteria group bacterium]